MRRHGGALESWFCFPVANILSYNAYLISHLAPPRRLHNSSQYTHQSKNSSASSDMSLPTDIQGRDASKDVIWYLHETHYLPLMYMLSLPLYSIIRNWAYHLYKWDERDKIPHTSYENPTKRYTFYLDSFLSSQLGRILDFCFASFMSSLGRILLFVLLLLFRHLDVFWFLVVFAFVEILARYFTFCRLLSWEIIDLSIGGSNIP